MQIESKKKEKRRRQTSWSEMQIFLGKENIQ